jgi:hypothetical protein
MECGQFEKMLPEYLEEALTPEAIGRIEKHLISCQKCRTALTEYKKTQELIKALEEVEPPPGFAQKIMVQVREEAQEKRGLLKKLFYPLHIKVPIQAIATVVIAALAIQVYRSVEPQKAAIQPPVVFAPLAPAPVPLKEEPRQEKKQEMAPFAATESFRTQDNIQVSRERRSKDKEAEPTPAASVPLKSQIQEEKAPMAPSQEPKKREVAKEGERSGAFLASKQAQKGPQTAAPSPVLRMQSPGKAEAINVKIRAQDVFAASQAVTAILEELGGSKIERLRGDAMEVITANLQGRRVKDLIEKLDSVGETEEKTVPSGISEELVALRIEILKK